MLRDTIRNLFLSTIPLREGFFFAGVVCGKNYDSWCSGSAFVFFFRLRVLIKSTFEWRQADRLQSGRATTIADCEKTLTSFSR